VELSAQGRKFEYVELSGSFYDGIPLWLTPKNNFAEAFKVDELKQSSHQGKITNWNQVRLTSP